MKDTRVVSLELGHGAPELGSLAGYKSVLALTRWHGEPIGSMVLPVENGIAAVDKIVTPELGEAIVALCLRHALRRPAPQGYAPEVLLRQGRVPASGELPTVTIAVCTRDRSASLGRCLDSLEKLSHRPLEILVIDNSPQADTTRSLVAGMPNVRYILEPRPGLDWARNRAITEARGEIIAFADDDVIVDSGFVKAFAEIFGENPWLMAATGLVMPYELETDAQRYFEECGGFCRGFQRRWFRTQPGEPIGWKHGGTGKFGTGANMAFRRCVFEQIGGFDPALDVGTVTQGGGDLEMFFRVLKQGHMLAYEPAAVVWHQHRRDYASLKVQLASNGVGFFSYVVRTVRAYPSESFGFLWLCGYYFWWGNLRRVLRSLIRPGKVPGELYWAEFCGSFPGLLRYFKARARAEEIKQKFAGLTPELPEHCGLGGPRRHKGRCTAVRTVDLKVTGIGDLTDISDYRAVRLYVLWGGVPLGAVTIESLHRPVSGAEVADHLVKQLGSQLLQVGTVETNIQIMTNVLTLLRRHLGNWRIRSTTASHFSKVSVVVPTYDRPTDLRRCLGCLVAQKTGQTVEIIVVDNRPESGLTKPVVSEFPDVRLIEETRAGLSYARNAGFRAATGEILIATDDDVAMPEDWLEKLLVPFAREDVAMVTGAVFPLELETEAQIQFEYYGGLGRGFERREFDRKWFDSFRRRAVPTWEMGATANAAIRASALANEEIGLLDEALGAGSPTGCGEDTYLFYRVLKAGYVVIYEAEAFVWHRHRRDNRALRRQVYNYSKGHTAYHLTTLFRDHDFRALTRLAAELPIYFAQFVRRWICREREFPMALLLPQVAGYMAGAFALWRSQRRVKKLGKSAPNQVARRGATMEGEIA